MKKRRILAMVLSLAMVMTAVPVSVFGEEADALLEDEVLVEEAGAVEETAEPVEAAPETEAPAEEVEAPVEEAAPADELIIEDAVEPEAEEVKVPVETEAAPEDEVKAEFIDVIEDADESEADPDLSAAQEDKEWEKYAITISNGSVTYNFGVGATKVYWLGVDDGRQYGGPITSTLDVSEGAGRYYGEIVMPYLPAEAKRTEGIHPDVKVWLDGASQDDGVSKPLDENLYSILSVDNKNATYHFSDKTPLSMQRSTPARIRIHFDETLNMQDVFVDFEIQPMDISHKKLIPEKDPDGETWNSGEYTGQENVPAGLRSLKLDDGKTGLTYGKDYLFVVGKDLSIDDCIDAGTHDDYGWGIGNYSGMFYNEWYEFARFVIESRAVRKGDIDVLDEPTFYLHTASGGSTVPGRYCDDEKLRTTDLFGYLQDNVTDGLRDVEEFEVGYHSEMIFKYYRASDTFCLNELGRGAKAPGNMNETKFHNDAKNQYAFTPGRYKYVIEFGDGPIPSTWNGVNFKNSDTGYVLEGYYTIKDYPDLSSMQGALQEAVDKQINDNPNIKKALTYNGTDKKSFVEGEILSWITKNLEHGSAEDPNLAWKLEATCNVDEMIDADRYGFTIRNLRDGDELGEDTVEIFVNVFPRQMTKYVNDSFNGSIKDYDPTDFEIFVEQWLHSDGTYSQKWPAKVQIWDLGLYTPEGDKLPPVPLTEGEDYTWVPAERVSKNGAISSIKITGHKNYITSIQVGSGSKAHDEIADANYELDPSEIPLKASLRAPFITAVINRTFDWHGRGSTEDSPGSLLQEVKDNEVIVEEEFDNGDKQKVVPSTDYFVCGYDPDDPDYPTTPDSGFPASAGKHYAVIKGKGGRFSDKDEDNRAADFQVIGQPMADKFDLRGGTIPQQEMLVKVVAPTPDLYLKGVPSETPNPVPKERFVYRYWHYVNGEKVYLKTADNKHTYVNGNDIGDGTKLTDENTMYFTDAGEYYVSVYLRRAASTSTWSFEEVDDYVPFDVQFIVGARDIGDPKKVTVSVEPSIEWPGQNVTSSDLNIHVRDIDKGFGLTEGTDYVVSIDPDNVCSKDVTVTIEGIGNYEGKVTAKIEVRKRDLSDTERTRFTITGLNQPYAGGALYDIPSDDVKVEILNSQKVWIQVDSSEYSVKFKSGYSQAVVGGSYDITVVGAENHYTGTWEVGQITIVPANIGNTKYVDVLPIDDQQYSGSEIKPAVSLQFKMAGLTDAQKTIDPSNYDVAYDNNTDAGTAHVTLSAKGSSFEGTRTTTFKITPLESTLKATIDKEKILTTETAKITVTGAVGKVSYAQAGTGKVSIADDGTVTGVTAGDVTITVKEEGDNNHVAGSVDLALKVEKKAEDIGTFTATVEGGPFVYNGKEQKPNVVVMSDGKSLTAGTDYDVTYADNIAAGEATYTLAGKGAYDGTIIGHFTIQKAKNTITLKAKSATKYYSTSVQTTTKLAGAKATGGTITYASDSATITVDPKTGKISIPAKTMGRANITITATDPNYETATAAVTLTVQPKKVKLNSAKMDKGKARLKWTKAPDCSGYVVKLSSAKTFKSDVEYVWVKKENASTTRFIKHMQTGKTYYFKVKVYKNIPGQKKVYSVYSNVKSLKISK